MSISVSVGKLQLNCIKTEISKIEIKLWWRKIRFELIVKLN